MFCREEEHRGGEYPLELTQTGEADVASYGGGAGGCVGDIPVLAAPHLVVGVRGDGEMYATWRLSLICSVQRPRGGVEVEREPVAKMRNATRAWNSSTWTIAPGATPGTSEETPVGDT